MSDINTCCVSGNLSADPEAGNGVLKFCVAVNRSVKNDDGSYREEASFVDCKVFGSRAQGLSQILRKGMPVTVQGELRQERWQSQDGQNRSRLVVVAREVKLPPRPKDVQAAQPYAAQPYQAQPYAAQPYQQAAPYQGQPYQQPAAYQAQPYQAPAPQVYDEEIPF